MNLYLNDFISKLSINTTLIKSDLINLINNSTLNFAESNKYKLKTQLDLVTSNYLKNPNTKEKIEAINNMILKNYISNKNSHPTFLIKKLERFLKYRKEIIHITNLLSNSYVKQSDCLPSNYDYIAIASNETEFLTDKQPETSEIFEEAKIDVQSIDQAGVAISFWIHENQIAFRKSRTDVIEIFNSVRNNEIVSTYSLQIDKTRNETSVNIINHIFRFGNVTLTIPSVSVCAQYVYVLLALQKDCNSYKVVISMRFAGVNKKQKIELPLQPSDIERLSIIFTKNYFNTVSKINLHSNFVFSDFEDLKIIYGVEDYDRIKHQHSIKISELEECNTASTCIYTGTNKFDYCDICKSEFFNYNKQCVSKCPGGTYANNRLKCIQCKEDCEECTAANQCTKCKSNLKLYQGKCLSDCPENTIAQTNIDKNNSNQVIGLTCEICDENCALCSPNKNLCLMCAKGYYTFKGKCVKECSEGYYNEELTKSCAKCSSRCRRCQSNGFVSNKCNLCNDGYFLLDGYCHSYCDAGYYQNNSTLTCDECPTDCSDCTKDRTSCEKCKYGYELNANSITLKNSCVSKCPEGNVMLSGVCQKCLTDNCNRCSPFDLNICRKCNRGFFVKDGKCVNSCGDGYYLDIKTSECRRCSENCDSCTDANKCLNCIKPKLLLNDNICIDYCPDGYAKIGSVCVKCKSADKCRVCSGTDISICMECQYGQVLYEGICLDKCPDTTITKDGVCIKCTQNCEKCNNLYSCKQCSNGFVKKNGACVKECGNAFVLNERTSQCEKCTDPLCESCYPNNMNNCKKCKSGTYVYNFNCVNNCPAGTFPNSNGQCENCISGCSECLTKYDCKKCNGNLLMQNDKCVETCDEGFSNINTLGQCVKCDDNNCIKCGFNLNKCLECGNNKILQEGSCVDNQSITPGYYLDTITNSAKKCDNNCKNCVNSPTRCTECSSSLKLLEDFTCSDECPIYKVRDINNNSICAECTQAFKCRKCNPLNRKECYQCERGFKLDKVSLTCVKDCPINTYESNEKCETCPDKCEKCESKTGKCFKCSEGFSLLGTECIKKCPAGFVEIIDTDNFSNTCIPCDSGNCLACYNSNTKYCYQCQKPFVLHNGQCIDTCPSGYNYSPYTNSCYECGVENCDKCYLNDNFMSSDMCMINKSTICSKCKEGFFLLNNKCSRQCTEGYTLNYLTNQCEKCEVSNCKCCYGDKSSCKQCQPSFYYNSLEKTCQPDCTYSTFLNIAESRCDPCAENCLVCSSRYSCTKCDSSTILLNGRCLPQCPYGYVQNSETGSCERCNDENCLKCVNTNSCVQCKFPYVLQNNKCLPICPYGTYLDTDLNECKKCSRSCIECKSADKCEQCSEGKFLIDGKYCDDKCQDNSVLINGICKPCQTTTTNCKKCSVKDLKNCEECVYPQVLLNNKCVNECPDGYYNDQNRNCLPCSTYCKVCKSENQCLECREGQFLINQKCEPRCPKGFYPNNNECKECPLNCPNCNNPTSCISCQAPLLMSSGRDQCLPVCPIGTYLDVTINQCKPCNFGCNKCESFDKCVDCADPLIYSNGMCVPHCSSGYVKINNKCEPCNSGCVECKSSTKECIKCKDNLVLLNGQCVSECPYAEGYYLDSKDKQCKRCTGEDCMSCTNSYDCSKCKLPKLLSFNNTCVDICPDGTVKVEGKCRECETKNCKSCTNNYNKCDECMFPRYLYKNNCTDICPTNTYKIDRNCYDCQNNCDICTGDNTCNKCTNNTVLTYVPDLNKKICISPCGEKMTMDSAGNCRNCTTYGCDICKLHDPNTCTACEKNTYLYFVNNTYYCLPNCPQKTYYNPELNRCENCQDKCGECQDVNTCKKCDSGFLLKDGKCVPRCEAQWVERNGKCYKCSDNCDQCDNLNTDQCTICAKNYYLKNGICVPSCEDGNYIETIDGRKKCLPCSKSCLECSNSKDCSRCQTPKVLKGDICVDDCGVGYVNDDFGKCIKCIDSNCNKCETNRPSMCTDCKLPNKLLNGKCIPSCPEGYFETPDKCIRCVDQNCLNCKIDAKICESCTPPKVVFMGECINSCPKGTTDINGICKNCLVKNCEICPPSDLSRCQVCTKGFLALVDNNYICIDTCPDGTYTDILNKKCVPCNNLRCTICSNQYKCDKCEDGFILENGRCVDYCPDGSVNVAKNNTALTNTTNCQHCTVITPHCKKCNITNFKECDECMDGYVLFNNNCNPKCPDGTFEYIKGHCRKCDSKCSKCDQTSYNCTECIAPYYKDENSNTCVVACLPGTIPINGKCTKCKTDESSCLSCNQTDLNYCDKCKDGYVKYNGTCIPFCRSGTYFDADSKSCYNCSENCKNCFNPNNNLYKLNCKDCDNGFNKHNGGCIRICPDNFFANAGECNQCSDTNCKRCRDNTKNTCDECLPPYKNFEGDCVKECTTENYEDGNQCKKCSTGCLDCQSWANCKKCKPPMILSDGKCVDPKCPQGYVLRNGECYECADPNCNYCDPAKLTDCKDCKDGTFKFQEKCVKNCTMGYFPSDFKTCQPCDINCESCKGFNQCDKCKEGFYKDANGKCTRCNSDEWVRVNDQCKPCTVNYCDKCLPGIIDQCKDCRPGFYLTPNKKCEPDCPYGTFKNSTTNSCQSCDSNCFECENINGMCKKCKPPMINLGGSCVNSCPIGYTEYFDPDTNSIRCRKCRDTYCNSCEKSRPDKCIDCKSPYILFNSECVIECPSGFILSSDKRTCDACPEYCGSCRSINGRFAKFIIPSNGTSLVMCDTCEKGYKLKNGRCVQECDKGYFEDDQGRCIQCKDPNCRVCSPQDICRVCDPPLVLDKTTDKCTTYCPDGYYRDTINNRCEPCNNNCKLCKNLNQCEKCSEGYKFFNNTCIPVCPVKFTSVNSKCEPCDDPNCLTCEENTPSKCTNCTSITYLVNGHCNPTCIKGTYANSTTGKCEPCDQKCESCVNSTKCDSCKPEFYLKNYECNNKCQNNKVEINGKCICCNDHNCETCLSDQKSCIKCNKEFYLLENECVKVCPVGYFKNNNRECQKCNNGCEICLKSDECRKCYEGFFLKDYHCVKDCSAGYYGDCHSGTCLSCHESCERCFDGTNSKCAACNPGYYQSDNLCVVKENCKVGSFADENSRKCISCKIPNCDVCQNKDTCKKCMNGYTLNKEATTCSEFKTSVNVIRTPVIFSESTHEKFNVYNGYSFFDQLRSACVESKYFTISFWMRVITSDINTPSTVLLEIKDSDKLAEDIYIDEPHRNTHITFSINSTKPNEFKCVSHIQHSGAMDVLYEDCSFIKLNKWNFFAINVNNDRNGGNANLIVHEKKTNSTFYVSKNSTNVFDRSSPLISKASYLYINPSFKSNPIFELANMNVMEHLPSTHDIDKLIYGDKPYNCDSQCIECDTNSNICLKCANSRQVDKNGYCPGAFVSISSGLLSVKKSTSELRSYQTNNYLSSDRYTFITHFYTMNSVDQVIISLKYKNNNIIFVNVKDSKLNLRVANMATNTFVNSPENKIQIGKWYIIKVSITSDVVNAMLIDVSVVTKPNILIRDEYGIKPDEYAMRLTPDAFIELNSQNNELTLWDSRLYTNNLMQDEDFNSYLSSLRCQDNCAMCDNNLNCRECNQGYELIQSECAIKSLGKPTVTFNRISIYGKEIDTLYGENLMNKNFTMSIYMRKIMPSVYKGKTQIPHNLISVFDQTSNSLIPILTEEIRENFESYYLIDPAQLISEKIKVKVNNRVNMNGNEAPRDFFDNYIKRIKSASAGPLKPTQSTSTTTSTTSTASETSTNKVGYSVSYKNNPGDWIHVAITVESKSRLMLVNINDRNTNYTNSISFNLHPSINLNNSIIIGDRNSEHINMDFGPNNLYLDKVQTIDSIRTMRDSPPRDCDPSCQVCDYRTGYCNQCGKDKVQGLTCDIYYYGLPTTWVYNTENYLNIKDKPSSDDYNVHLESIFQTAIHSKLYSVVGWYQMFSLNNNNTNSGESILFRLSNQDVDNIREDDPFYSYYPGLNLITLKVIYRVPSPVYAFVVSDNNKDKIFEIKNLQVITNEWLMIGASIDVKDRLFSYNILSTRKNETISGNYTLDYVPQALQNIATLRLFGLNSMSNKNSMPVNGYFYNMYMVTNSLMGKRELQNYRSLYDPTLIVNICSVNCTNCVVGRCFQCNKGFLLNNNECVSNALAASYFMLTDQKALVQDRVQANFPSSIISDSYGFQFSIRRNYFGSSLTTRPIIELSSLVLSLVISETDAYIKIENRMDVSESINIGPLDSNPTINYQWHTLAINFRGKEKIIECTLFDDTNEVIEKKEMIYSKVSSPYSIVTLDNLQHEISIYGAVYIIGNNKINEPLLPIPEIDCPIDCAYCEKNNQCKKCTYGNECNLNDPNNKLCKTISRSGQNIKISENQLNTNTILMKSFFPNDKLIRFNEFVLLFSVSIKKNINYNNIVKIVNTVETNRYDSTSINHNLLTLSYKQDIQRFVISYHNRQTLLKFKNPISTQIAAYPSNNIQNEMHYIGISYNANTKTIECALLNTEDNSIIESIKIVGEMENLGLYSSLIFLDDFTKLNQPNTQLFVRNIQFYYETTQSSKELLTTMINNYKNFISPNCISIDSDNMTCKNCLNKNLPVGGICTSENIPNQIKPLVFYPSNTITSFTMGDVQPITINFSNQNINSFTLQFSYRRFSEIENETSIMSLTLYNSDGKPTNNIYELYETKDSLIGYAKMSNGGDIITTIPKVKSMITKYAWLSVTVQVDYIKSTNTIHIFNYNQNKSSSKKSIGPNNNDNKSVSISSGSDLKINFDLLIGDSSTRMSKGNLAKITNFKLANFVFIPNYLYDDNEIVSLRPNVPSTCKCACVCVDNVCPESCHLTNLYVDMSKSSTGNMFDSLYSNIKSSIINNYNDIDSSINTNNNDRLNQVKAAIDYNEFTIAFSLNVQAYLSTKGSASASASLRRSDRKKSNSYSHYIDYLLKGIRKGPLVSTSSTISTSNVVSTPTIISPVISNSNSISTPTDVNSQLLVLVTNKFELVENIKLGTKISEDLIDYSLLAIEVVDNKLRVYIGSDKSTQFISFKEAEINLLKVDRLFVLFSVNVLQNTSKLIIFADNMRYDHTFDFNFAVENINMKTFYYTNKLINNLSINFSNNIDKHLEHSKNILDQFTAKPENCPQACKTCMYDRCIECSAKKKMYNNVCLDVINTKSDPNLIIKNKKRLIKKKNSNRIKAKLFSNIN